MKNKFLQISIGISIIMLSLTFLLRSINHADAAPPVEKFLSEGTNTIGKYQMNMVITSTGNANVLVWDTETGKSTYYYYSSGWKKAEGLPDSPMGN